MATWRNDAGDISEGVGLASDSVGLGLLLRTAVGLTDDFTGNS